ncbi:hypothetical protein BLNAU_16357 [Blattamonas nauphoetae]|uniref:Uncharacterized protein n=1 Tax=Blattamonas nauphoetae TaxID=2049346 RepID=A0ABQ9XBG8_9EUKA|nr:hypothetical protein BLNAU_16357 [Blattamonas nauphoetae]
MTPRLHCEGAAIAGRCAQAIQMPQSNVSARIRFKYEQSLLRLQTSHPFFPLHTSTHQPQRRVNDPHLPRPTCTQHCPQTMSSQAKPPIMMGTFNFGRARSIRMLTAFPLLPSPSNHPRRRLTEKLSCHLSAHHPRKDAGIGDTEWWKFAPRQFCELIVVRRDGHLESVWITWSGKPENLVHDAKEIDVESSDSAKESDSAVGEELIRGMRTAATH